MSAKNEIIHGGNVVSPRGFYAGAVYAGIKQKSTDVLDLAVLFSETVCNAAAVFTRNRVQAAPVIIDRKKLAQHPQAQALIVNSGCANACTGTEGLANAERTASLAAAHLGIDEALVQVASTGVIGVQLPIKKIAAAVPQITISPQGGNDFTRAIMTTDRQPKTIAIRVQSGETVFTVGGTAKGSGMIHPDMATMLCFITTDAAVETDFLQAALNRAVDCSFNLVTVDGDTSTNDTVLVMAGGQAGNPTIKKSSPLAGIFEKTLQQVCIHLAKCVARDGEGATRLIEVQINGARSVKDAKLAALAIAGSPLVKTAVHGCDPNWGRIIAAAGRSGAELAVEKADVYIGDMCLMQSGTPVPFEKKRTARILKEDEVRLRVDLNLGKGHAVAWGCDLSEDYVAINSEYTT